MKVICDNCGKEFNEKPVRVKRASHHFCSKVCYDIWRKDPIITGYCSYCGRLIQRLTSEWDRSENHFCNHICYGKWISKTLLGPTNPKWNRVKANCSYCGKSFQTHPYRLESSNHHFCTMSCYAAWQGGENSGRWKGGYELYYGSDWKRQRRRARNRDGFQCRICGIEEKDLGRHLDVHHIIPFRKFGLRNFKTANCLSNLRSLCPDCHKELEILEPKEQVRQTTNPNNCYTTLFQTLQPHSSPLA